MNDLFIIALLIAGGYYLLTSPVKNKSQSTQTDLAWSSLVDKNQQLIQQIEAYRTLTTPDHSELTQALTTLLHNLQTLNQTI